METRKTLLPLASFLGLWALLVVFNEPARQALGFVSFFPWLDEHVLLPVFKTMIKVFSQPLVYAAIAAVLYLEYRYPARPEQKTFSVGFVHDAVWFIVQLSITATLTASYVIFLKALYRDQLDFLTIAALRDWPMAAKFPIWLLVTDFLMWLHHWLRHKVAWLWHFHTVHHSQKQMNLFTDMRYHAVEYAFAETVMIVPVMMVGADTNAVLGFGFVHRWYTRFYHANIRSDYGPLRRLFVTPQSHRIHHSSERRHFDKNFGVIFSIWDRMFGTHYEGAPDEYPETGIPDPEFPHEQEPGFASLLATPVRQHVYPFQAIARDLKAGWRRR